MKRKIQQSLLLSLNMKLSLGLQLIHLHLTLAHSKGPGQSHAQFDCEYLVNGDKYGNNYYCRHIGSHVWAFQCYFYV